MNWDAIAALSGALGFLSSLAVAIYFYGRMSKSQEILAQIAERHEGRLDKHDEKLSEHGERIAALEPGVR